MEKKTDVCLDMNILMSELKEALSTQVVKTDTGDEDMNRLTEKLAHLFSIKEFDLFLLFIKTSALKYRIALPDVFNQEHYDEESKESLCVAIIANCLKIL